MFLLQICLKIKCSGFYQHAAEGKIKVANDGTAGKYSFIIAEVALKCNNIMNNNIMKTNIMTAQQVNIFYHSQQN